MPSQWLKNLGHKASHVKMLRPLYDAQLGKINQPLVFESFPGDILGGDAGRGRWIVSGQVDINGRRVPLDMDHWLIGGDLQNSPFYTQIHRFDCLTDLKALGGDMGRRAARKITSAWIAAFDDYHHLTWEPILTAHRLVNWLGVYAFAFEQADEDVLMSLHNAIYRQFQHLAYTLDHDPNLATSERFTLLWGLCVVGLHCPHLAQNRLESWLILLKGAVEDVSHDDGGVTSGTPADGLDMARDLMMLRQSLTMAGVAPPLWLSKRIELVLRHLNHLTHMDKALPCFHGGVEDGKNEVEKMTRLAGLRVRRHDICLKDSGYSAMRKGKTAVIVNHGHGVHTGPHAFEMSHHNQRLIVNCGTHLYHPDWRESLGGIAAHSTLSVAGAMPDISCMGDIKAQIETVNGACLWSGTHEGYKADFQTTHTRRLYLDPEGHDMRGEDVVIRSIATKPLPVIIRFHLHPMVKASLIKDGQAVLMQLRNGAGWMMEASGGFIGLEDSIYIGQDGLTPRKTEQIVLTADVTDINHQFKWAIRRV